MAPTLLVQQPTAEQDPLQRGQPCTLLIDYNAPVTNKCLEQMSAMLTACSCMDSTAIQVLRGMSLGGLLSLFLLLQSFLTCWWQQQANETKDLAKTCGTMAA